MVTQVITVCVSDSLSAVEEKFRRHRIRHLPVMDEKKRVAGVVTLSDLSRCATPKKIEEGYFYDKEQLNEFILKYVMTPNPQTLKPEDSVFRCVEIMAREKFGCLPVVHEDRTLAGIVTQIDVLKFVYRWMQLEN